MYIYMCVYKLYAYIIIFTLVKHEDPTVYEISYIIPSLWFKRDPVKVTYPILTLQGLILPTWVNSNPSMNK